LQKISSSKIKLDLYLFNFINGFAKKQKWLDFVAIFFARYLGYIIIVVLAVLAFKDINIFITPVLAGLFSRFILNESVYFFYKRKRPSETVDTNQLLKNPNHPALPSGHASFFFAVSFALLFLDFNLGIIFLIASFFIGFFRVFAGVHWPSDILSGIVAGGISATIINYLL